MSSSTSWAAWSGWPKLRVIVPARPRNSSGTESRSRTVTLALTHPFTGAGWIKLSPHHQGTAPRQPRRSRFQILGPEQPVPAVSEPYFHGHVLTTPVTTHDPSHCPSPGFDSVVASHSYPGADACLLGAHELPSLSLIEATRHTRNTCAPAPSDDPRRATGSRL